MRIYKALFFSVLTLTGCASVDSPPDHWLGSIDASSSECPDISGIYNNHGIGVDEKHTGYVLTHHIFNQAAQNWTQSDVEERARFSKASHVKFLGPNKSALVIEAWLETELIERIELEQNVDDGFGCDHGVLFLSLPVYASTGGGIFFDAFRETAIMPTKDGALLVKSSSKGFGLGFYLIPLTMKFETWALYPAFNLNIQP